MEGRAFLFSARLLLRRPTEANRRSAVGRGYFAVLNEARDALVRWGFAIAAGVNIDAEVIELFGRAVNMDAVRVWDVLTRLLQQRLIADYSLNVPGDFADESEVGHLLRLSQIGIDVLDELEADPTRRAATVAAIHAGTP